MRTFASLSVGAGLCLAATLGPSTHGNIGIGLGLFFFCSLTFCPCLTVCLHYCGTWGLYAVEGGKTRVAPNGGLSPSNVLHTPTTGQQMRASQPSAAHTTTLMPGETTNNLTAGETTASAATTTASMPTAAVTPQPSEDRQDSSDDAASASALQNAWRRREANRRVLEIREQQRALMFVTRLQAMVRRKKSSRAVLAMAAATRIQRRWRSRVRPMNVTAANL